MSITAKEITSRLEQSILAGGWNRIKPEDAIREELAGMPIYDAPIFGFGDAHDPLFHTWKSPQVMHPDVLLPQDWLPGPGHRQGKGLSGWQGPHALLRLYKRKHPGNLRPKSENALRLREVPGGCALRGGDTGTPKKCG